MNESYILWYRVFRKEFTLFQMKKCVQSHLFKGKNVNYSIFIKKGSHLKLG